MRDRTGAGGEGPLRSKRCPARNQAAPVRAWTHGTVRFTSEEVARAWESEPQRGSTLGHVLFDCNIPPVCDNRRRQLPRPENPRASGGSRIVVVTEASNQVPASDVRSSPAPSVGLTRF